MCVNGATRAAGGGRWSAYGRCRVVMHFFVGIECSGDCDGFGGVTGGKREESRGNFSGINGICSKK